MCSQCCWAGRVGIAIEVVDGIGVGIADVLVIVVGIARAVGKQGRRRGGGGGENEVGEVRGDGARAHVHAQDAQRDGGDDLRKNIRQKKFISDPRASLGHQLSDRYSRW